MNTMTPITIFSISFENSIPLYDPATDQVCNQAPQWDRYGMRAPVAYEQGAMITFSATFLDQDSQALGLVVTSVYAEYSDGALPPTAVALQFDTSSGITTSLPASFKLILPNAIGEHTYTLRWFAICCTLSGEMRPPYPIGESTHTICTVWRRPGQPAQGERLYEPLLRWSCQWIAEETGRQSGSDYSSKRLCDALIHNLHRAQLRYGLDGMGQTTRGILLRGGGMCGAWALLFQSLARCQGIALTCCDLTLVRRQATPSSPTITWQAAVATSGGINQKRPQTNKSTYQEDSSQWPLQIPLEEFPAVTTYRYLFAGQDPSLTQINPSTHTITILRDGEDRYIYDPSFAFGPVQIEKACLESKRITGAALTTFKERYLDAVFPFLLGRTEEGVEITVQTAIITPDAITIAWRTPA